MLLKSAASSAGIHGIGIGQRGLEMPDPLELPRVRRPIVPGVGAGRSLIDELVTNRLPGLAAVVRALDHLPEPATGLRCIQSIRIDRRTLDVEDLPAREVGATDLPVFALAVRRQNECSLSRTNQDPYRTHAPTPSWVFFDDQGPAAPRANRVGHRSRA